MGGSNATALPEEESNHVDSVVIGEAEGIWNEDLQDFIDHLLRRIYRNYPFVF